MACSISRMFRECLCTPSGLPALLGLQLARATAATTPWGDRHQSRRVCFSLSPQKRHYAVRGHACLQQEALEQKEVERKSCPILVRPTAFRKNAVRFPRSKWFHSGLLRFWQNRTVG